jgi:hypothetical protein
MGTLTKFFLLSSLAFFANALLTPIIYEEFEVCTEEGEEAGVFNLTDLEIFAESDLRVYLNGSWTFLQEVKSPWNVIIFMEKLIRNQWSVEILNKDIPDFCEVIQKPTEPWFSITSKFTHRECPFQAGVRWQIQ